MAAKQGVRLLGRCLPFFPGKSIPNASRIQIKTLELDENLYMYFSKEDTLFAHDPGQMCRPGDIVLIKSLAEKLTPLINHEVLKVVYPLGDVVDPITQKKVVGPDYRDELEFISEQYGKSDKAFDYNKAPPRGWQEDKKDFSHKQSYRRFQVYDKEDKQPYAVDH